MALDFGKPATSDNYSTQFVPNLQGNMVGLAQLLDSSQTTVTGTVPQYVKRYNRTSTALEEWSGSAWAPITLQGIRFSSGNLAVGVAPIASVPWTVHTGTNRNVSMLDQSSMATLTALTDAGSSTALRLVGNTLVFSGNGSAEHARLDATGNLGVGGTSAGERFSVFGTARIAGGTGTVASLTLTGGASNFQFNHTTGSGVAQIANSGGVLAFAAGGVTSQMFLDGSGRLGVNVPSPSARLDVAGPVGSVNDTSGTVRLSTDAASTDVAGALGAGVVFAQRWNSATGAVRVGGIYGIKTASTGNFGGGLAVYTQTDGGGGDMAERLRVNGLGRLIVGRATDSGLGLLQVSGGGDFAPASGTATLYVRGVTGANAALEISSHGAAAGNGISLLQDNSYIAYLYNRQNAALVFGTNNTTQMTLSATGALTLAAQPGFRATRGTGPTVGTGGSYATVIFNTEEFDNGGCHNTSTGEFTAPVAGRYQISYALCPRFEAGTATGEQFLVIITKNGATIDTTRVDKTVVTASQQVGPTVRHSDVYQLAAGDVILVRATFNGASSFCTTNGLSFSATLLN